MTSDVDDMTSDDGFNSLKEPPEACASVEASDASLHAAFALITSAYSSRAPLNPLFDFFLRVLRHDKMSASRAGRLARSALSSFSQDERMDFLAYMADDSYNLSIESLGLFIAQVLTSQDDMR